MLTPFNDTLGRYMQFLILWMWILMIAFVAEMIIRSRNRVNEKGRKIFTVIYITIGSCLAVFITYSGRRTLQAELETWERTWPWLIGGVVTAVTTWFIHKGSKTTK